MHWHIAGVDALHTADGNTLGFVLVLVPRLPESLCGAISQTANHCWTTGSFNVHYTGQVFQAGHQAEILQSHIKKHNKLLGL